MRFTQENYPHKISEFISEERIKSKTFELGAQITKDYKNSVSAEKPLVLICVLKGSILFTADLARAIDIPVEIEAIGVSSYGDGKESSGKVKRTVGLSKDLEGRDVIIVEDIVDTGLSAQFLLKDLGLHKPKSLKFCSLLEKPDKNTLNIRVDYLGFSIEDKFVIGYGLDFAGLYRNLPFVGLMEGDV